MSKFLKLVHKVQTVGKFIAFSSIFIVIFNVSAELPAQQRTSTATATMTATIVRPIGITNKTDMNFGNIVSGNIPGKVTLEPAGKRSATAGISLPSESGNVTAASFQVTGEGAYAYTITLPTSDYTITRVSGSETMLINNFTSAPSGTGTLISGTQTILIGATLTIGTAQAIGEYVNESGFNVTVNYN